MRVVMLLAIVAGCATQGPGGQSLPAQKAPKVKTPEPIYGPGNHPETIDEGGTKRVYEVKVPSGYNGKRQLPLVMLLHGWTESASSIETTTEMDKLCDKAGFLLVAPEGLGNPKGWNCGFLNLGGNGADDVKFLTDVLDAVDKKVKVDPRRVFVAGHSNGGMMAYLLAAKLSGRIAAIGVVSGTVGFDRGDQLGEVPAPSKPVSALIIHGLLDPTVPYNHGPSLLPNCVSAPDAAKYWAHADGIDTPPTRTVAAKGKLEQLDWRAGHVEVKLISLADGTHDWPGGLNADGRETASGFDASEQIWSFFAHHPKS